jgi:hypothetical protein
MKYRITVSGIPGLGDKTKEFNIDTSVPYSVGDEVMIFENQGSWPLLCEVKRVVHAVSHIKHVDDNHVIFAEHKTNDLNFG